MDDEEWSEDDTETVVGTCDRCGEEKPLQRRTDPFVREGIIDDDGDAEWHVCRPCYEQRCDDV